MVEGDLVIQSLAFFFPNAIFLKKALIVTCCLPKP
jgi:hypothetical protein